MASMESVLTCRKEYRKRGNEGLLHICFGTWLMFLIAL